MYTTLSFFHLRIQTFQWGINGKLPNLDLYFAYRNVRIFDFKSPEEHGEHLRKIGRSENFTQWNLDETERKYIS